ncbi:MAG: outer membrane protein assembly factor BamB, partial [Gammaproteobacteria bacterium]|nr:outer membrane protein assembly factor BamB [Gammaproteobacteria bacterium]
PPPKPVPPNPEALDIVEAWSHDVGWGGGELLLGLAAEGRQGKVYAASADGNVAAFDAASGAKAWSRDLEKSLSGGPAAGNGLVVVGTRDGDAIALDAESGKTLWSTYVGAPPLANPAVGPDIVAVKTIAGALIGLSPKTGRILWQISQRPPSLTLRFGIQPLIVNGVVYAGFADGSVIAADAATGEEQWRATVARPSGNNPVANLINVGGVMAWAAGDLYASTYQGRVAALSSFSGNVIWSHELSSYTGVRLDGSYVYVSGSDGRIHAFDLVTGVPKWVNDVLGYRRLSASVPFGPVVAVGDRFGWLHFFSREDGRYLDRVETGRGPVRMPPVVAGGHLIVLNDDGSLVAYDVSPKAKQGS